MAENPVALHSDPRWKQVEATLRRHAFKPTALIEAMHTVQQAWGYLDSAALRQLAQTLGVPPSKVQGVATFYHHFTLSPPSPRTCVVCTGTSCHLKGAVAILAALERKFDLKPGEMRQGLSLQVTRCEGTCALAPLVRLNGTMIAYTSAEEVVRRVAEVEP